MALVRRRVKVIEHLPIEKKIPETDENYAFLNTSIRRGDNTTADNATCQGSKDAATTSTGVSPSFTRQKEATAGGHGGGLSFIMQKRVREFQHMEFIPNNRNVPTEVKMRYFSSQLEVYDDKLCPISDKEA